VVNIRVHEAEKLGLEAIRRFVEASEGISFESEDRQQLYGWVERVLVRQHTSSKARWLRAFCGATLRR
jgi:hypothetical protein